MRNKTLFVDCVRNLYIFFTSPIKVLAFLNYTFCLLDKGFCGACRFALSIFRLQLWNAVDLVVLNATLLASQFWCSSSSLKISTNGALNNVCVMLCVFFSSIFHSVIWLNHDLCQMQGGAHRVVLSVTELGDFYERYICLFVISVVVFSTHILFSHFYFSFLKNGFSLFSKLLSALLAHRRIIHRPAHITNKHSRNVLCFYMKYISGMPCNSTKLRLPARLPNFYGKFHAA